MDAVRQRLIKEQCYVNGEWIGEASTPVHNPADGSLIAQVPNFGRAETAGAIEAATQAFITWRQKIAKDRSRLLKAWYDAICRHREGLARLITMEQGKPLTEAQSEVDYGASFVEFFAEEAKRVRGEIIPSHRDGAKVLVLKDPVGVVGAITPWNFPLAMITRKVAPALAAGCSVVCKPAPDTPLTALALAQLAEDVGFPPGVLNVLTGDAEKIGAELTSHPDVRMITFTGSTAVGKLLMEQCARTVKKVSLELGGNAPFIVFDDADIERAADGLMASKFRNMGQTCVCANRVLVQEGVFDAFCEAVETRVGALNIGDGMDEGVDQGPLVNEAGVKKVEAHIGDACEKGAQLILGGRRHSLGGSFFEPTILSGATEQMLVAQEETFGPVVALFRFSSEEEAIRLANNTRSGLAAYFYTSDQSRAWRVGEALEYGIVGVNEGLISSEIAPFGGVKESGLGREGSHHGIDEFIEMKYLLMGGLSS